MFHTIYIIQHNHGHRALARFFIKEYTELILLHYTGSHYYGETCLHIACIHNDVTMFKYLLKCGANAAAPRACGSFFMPYPQKKLRHALVSEGVMPRSVAERLHNLSTYCYFGEFLLGFAASSGQKELVELCLDHGCDINAQDTLGNTVLHIIVLSDNKYKNGCCAGMFGLLQKRGADLNIKNDEGLTPLTTAAVLGNLQLFDHVLKMYRQTMWTYGPITCFSYNLCSLDLASSIKADDINMPNKYESDDDESDGESDESEEDMVYAIKPEGSIEESVTVQKPSAPIVKFTSKRKEARRSHPCRRMCQQICRQVIHVCKHDMLLPPRCESSMLVSVVSAFMLDCALYREVNSHALATVYADTVYLCTRPSTPISPPPNPRAPPRTSSTRAQGYYREWA